MAYLKLEISGNKKFGGYLSVDADRSFKVEDGAIFQMSEGQHIFQLNSSSDFNRGMGNFRGKLYNMTSSSGSILDTLEANDIKKSIGDSWSFQAVVEDGQAVVISILSKGEKIISAPMYNIIDLDDETLASLEEHFTEIRAERERIANIPRRSGKMIGIGLFLMIVFGGMLGGTLSNTAAIKTDNPTMMYAMWGVMVAIGLLVFILGMRKKVRK